MADAGTRPIASERRSVAPERRLLARASGARPLLAAGIVCGFAAAVLVVAAAYLTSVAVADVFLGGADLAAIAADCSPRSPLLAVARTPLLVAGELADPARGGRLKARLRADLTGHLLAARTRLYRPRAERGAGGGRGQRHRDARRLRHDLPARPRAGGRGPAARARGDRGRRPADGARARPHGTGAGAPAGRHRRPGAGRSPSAASPSCAG